MKKLIKFLVIVAVIVIGVIFIFKHFDLGFNIGNQGGFIESKELDRSDLLIKFGEQGLTSVNAIVYPYRDIEYVTIRVTYFDANGVILKREDKTFNNLIKHKTYVFEYKYGLFESFNFSTYSFEMISGRRA